MDRLSIPSCGKTLLQSNSWDYTLYITDGKEQYAVRTHKCVLLAHSEKMRELIGGSTFFECSIQLHKGYITACLELLQYLYMKAPSMIKQVDKVLELCGMFRIPYEHIVIRKGEFYETDMYETVQVRLEPDVLALTACHEFLQNIVGIPRQLEKTDVQTQTEAEVAAEEEAVTVTKKSKRTTTRRSKRRRY